MQVGKGGMCFPLFLLLQMIEKEWYLLPHRSRLEMPIQVWMALVVYVIKIIYKCIICLSLPHCVCQLCTDNFVNFMSKLEANHVFDITLDVNFVVSFLEFKLNCCLAIVVVLFSHYEIERDKILWRIHKIFVSFHFIAN